VQVGERVLWWKQDDWAFSSDQLGKLPQYIGYPDTATSMHFFLNSMNFYSKHFMQFWVMDPTADPSLDLQNNIKKAINN
jgi:hypothetical protein